MTNRGTKRTLAWALSLSLLLGLLPPAAFAAGEGPTCPNHPTHEGCGYVEAVEGQPCTHECELCAPKDSGTPPDTSEQNIQNSTPSDAAPGRAAVASGTCGDPNVNDGADVTWELDGNGTLTISGIGAMVEFLSSQPWQSHSGKIQTVVIEDGVTTISKYAFSQFPALERVEIGNSVETIGTEAFALCLNLESITIPDSVKTIGSLAFYSCGLTSVKIGNSLETIDGNPFAGCVSLTTLTVDVKNPYYQSQNNLVRNKNGDTLVFAAGGLETVAIPEGVETIGTSAFHGSALTSVAIPEGVETIGTSAFRGSALTSVAIPDSVRTIGGSAFHGSPLKSLTIQDGVETIGGSAFYGSALESVAIPDSVKTIGSNAFGSCADLTAVTVGSGLTTLDHNTFENCTALERVTFKGKQAPRIVFANGTEILFANAPSTLVIHVPKGAEGYNGRGWPKGKVREAVTVTLPAIQGVTAPATGATPVSTVAETAEYTGTVKWNPDPGAAFAAETDYTATITLTLKDGYTLEDVAANFFTVPGAGATNDADSGTVTAVFPKTGEATYTISADTSSLNFGIVPVGYATAPAAQTVTVTNTGNQTVTLNQPMATGTSYTVGTLSKTELALNDTATFTVQPKPGLEKNTYSETVTVTNTQGKSVSVALSFSVTDTYAVTVSGGTGGGSYKAGTSVTITATVPGGQQFTGWTISPDVAFTSGGKNTETSTFTMPAHAVEVTAGFEDIPTYTVTVNGGTASPASGSAGDAVTITATVPSGQRFKAWTGLDGLTITEGSAATEKVTFTMPARAVEVTARFENISTGGGGGGGSSSPSPTEQAVNKVEKAKDGDTVKVELPSGGKLPGKVLEEAAGKDITLEINAGKDATWIINGKDIPTGKLSDLNLKVNTKANTIPVTVINTLTGEKTVMQLKLSHNGEFPMPLTLRLETGKENAGLFANLYYYNETAKELEYQRTAKIGPDGKADIPFAHASSYAVIIDRESHAPVTEPGWENPFTDVGENDWFYEAVAYVHQQGLMVGITDTTFGPSGAVTRAQVWTVLARMSGADTSGGAPWYAPAQAWAVKTGVSDGMNPDGAVTREQLVTMLYRYAQSASMDVSVGEDTNILSYNDAFVVADWAVPAFQWACGAGILAGTTDNRLAPEEGATRAQIAAMLKRFLEQK